MPSGNLSVGSVVNHRRNDSWGFVIISSFFSSWTSQLASRWQSVPRVRRCGARVMRGACEVFLPHHITSHHSASHHIISQSRAGQGRAGRGKARKRVGGWGAEQSWGEKTSEQGRSRELDNSRRARPSLHSSPRTKGVRARVRRYAPPRAQNKSGTKGKRRSSRRHAPPRARIASPNSLCSKTQCPRLAPVSRY